VQRLHDAAVVTAYTPGSSAGVGLDLVGSLRAPVDGSDDEAVADEVQAYVTGLLGMAGLDADPLSSPEHILLTNLVHHAWGQGQDLDLARLVAQVQEPPLRKLGVLDLDTFIPAKERTALARRLNGLLASPTFAAWARGEPLDVDRLLRPEGPDGRPGCAVVTLSHLTDAERQFAVAAVLGKVVTWARRQQGTDQLRALVWFDEVAGFVPPTAAPPAKAPVLTLMKQARAAGLGVVLATQNPVDVDYKGIANAGTWAIGRLQTEQDRDRLLEGMSSAGGGVDTAAVGGLVAGLEKRRFVLRQPGEPAPIVLETRWALSYLRGPLTKEQLGRLKPPEAAAPTPAAAAPPAPPPPASDEVEAPPAASAGLSVRWLDPAAPWAAQVGAVPGGTRYEAALAVRVSLTYDERSPDVRHVEEWEAVLRPLADPLDPATAIAVDHDDRDLRDQPPPGARYALPAAPIDEKRGLEDAKRALVDHLTATRTHRVLVNRQLGLASRPGEDAAAFAARCDAAAEDRADDEAVDLRQKAEAKVARARDHLAAATDRLHAAEQRAESARSAELVDGAGSILGSLLGGRRRARSLARAASGAASRRRRTEEASEKVGSARHRQAELQATVDDLESEVVDDLLAMAARWDEVAAAVEVVEVPLERSDVRVVAASLLWVPTA
jgi:hypothetical protein